jgi:hypothetical protein
MPLLRWTHDHYCDLRALVPTAGAATATALVRKDPAVIRHGFLLKAQAATNQFRPTASVALPRPQTPTTSSNETAPTISSTSKRWIRRLLNRIIHPQLRTIARRAFDLSHHSFTKNHKSP